MSAKTILALLFVVSIVALAVVLLGRMSASTTATGPGGTQVLVASGALPAGTLLRPQDLKWADWANPLTPGQVVRPTAEERKAQPGADEAASEAVYGAVVRAPIAAGAPIMSDAIVKPGDRSFLAAVLAPGYRAIAIGVTAVSGAAGRIYPGDHVDVVLTQSFKESEQSPGRRSVSETVVEDLPVLAIDQHAPQAGATQDTTAPRTVTLEVLPADAEKINVANELGKLSLTLRSPGTGGVAEETHHATWAGDVSQALRDAPATPTGPRGGIRIIRGSTAQE